jgi:sarcosine oxidase
LATARALSQRGVEVVVLETASPGHPASGSQGRTRIFRLGYPDPLYADMAARSLLLWRDLEDEIGQTLLSTTGQLTFGPEVDAIAKAMEEVGHPATELSETARQERFPDFAIDGPALFEPDSGVLDAPAALHALAETADIDLRTGTPVRLLEDEGDRVAVTMADGTELAATVAVNCAGPHAVGLMTRTRIPSARPPTFQQVAYVAAEQPLPIFIEWGEDMIYGLPVPGEPLYKLAQHRPGPLLDPDHGPLEDDADLVTVLTDAAARIFPSLDPTPVATECCVYDNTVDGDFILDRLGQVVLGCGTSGHGFKFGPLFGELLADLVTGAESSVDLARFAATRSFLQVLRNP